MYKQQQEWSFQQSFRIEKGIISHIMYGYKSYIECALEK